VRLLRQVLQTTSLVSVRANILLARQQAQQERIGQMERQLADARNAAREAEAQVTQFAEYAASAEESLASETDPAKRAEKEEQMRQYNLVRSQVKHNIESQHERESELTTSLAEEQSKLEQIQRGLDGVENELESLQKKVPARAATEPAQGAADQAVLTSLLRPPASTTRSPASLHSETPSSSRATRRPCFDRIRAASTESMQ
jgi:predicted  nucleic acid-binding Zn-ribbon protein